MLEGATVDAAPAEAGDDDDDDDDDDLEGIGAPTEDVKPGEEEQEHEKEGKEEEEAAAPALEAITKERDEIKARLLEVEKERDALKSKTPAPVPTPTPASPLADVLDANALAAHRNFAEQLEDWAIDHNSEGGTMPAELDAVITGRTVEAAKAEPTQWSAEQTREMRKTAQQRLRRDIPQREQWLQMDARAEQYVQSHYPDALKPESETGKLYAQFEREFPAIKALPTWRVALLDCVRGAQLRIAEEQKRQGTKPGETTPPAAKPKGQDAPLAPVPPGKPAGAGAKPSVSKPPRQTPLKASMNASELAEML